MPRILLKEQILDGFTTQEILERYFMRLLCQREIHKQTNCFWIASRQEPINNDDPIIYILLIQRSTCIEFDAQFIDMSELHFQPLPSRNSLQLDTLMCRIKVNLSKVLAKL